MINKGSIPASGEKDLKRIVDSVRQIFQNAADADDVTAVEADVTAIEADVAAIKTAEIIVAAATTALSAERVLTDTPTVTWNFGTAGQAKATASVTGTLVAGTVLTKNPYSGPSTTTTAHGLGVAPTFLKNRLTCLTGEAGYSAGDVIDLGSSNLMERGSTSGTGIQVQVDATNVTLIIGDTLPALINKSTGAQTTITAANWRVDIVPYAIT